MNRTPFVYPLPLCAGDESCATQSPSKSSQPKSPDSSKAGDKRTKSPSSSSKSKSSDNSSMAADKTTNKSKSSTETPEEKEKRKRERKDKSSTETPEEKEKRKRERKDKSSTETPEEKEKRRRERKDKSSTETPEEKEKRKREKKDKTPTETPEEREKRKRKKKDKKQRKKEKKEKKEKESKSKDSTETPEEKAQRRQEKKERKEKESKSKDSTETPEEKAQRRQEKKERKEKKKQKKEKKNEEKENEIIDIGIDEGSAEGSDSIRSKGYMYSESETVTESFDHNGRSGEELRSRDVTEAFKAWDVSVAAEADPLERNSSPDLPLWSRVVAEASKAWSASVAAEAEPLDKTLDMAIDEAWVVAVVAEADPLAIFDWDEWLLSRSRVVTDASHVRGAPVEAMAYTDSGTDVDSDSDAPEGGMNDRGVSVVAEDDPLGDSKIQKEDDKAGQQQKLDVAENLQCRSLGTENVTQATDIDSNWSDDDSMDVSTMMDLHYGEQVEILGGSLTDDHASVFTQETMLHNEKENLIRTISTLRRRVEEVESENRQLNERNNAMQALQIQLIRAEEQLEHAKEEKHDFSTRIHALEQALVVQETELDDTPVTMKPIIFEAGPIGMLLGTTVNDQACRVDGFVDGGPDDPSQARKSGKIQMGDVIVSVNGIVPDSYEDTIDLLKEGGTREIVFRSGTKDDDYHDDYLSTDDIDDGLTLSVDGGENEAKKDSKIDSFTDDAERACSAQLQLSYHEKLAAVREELGQLRRERDRAIDKASELTITSKKCKAEVSESDDRVAGCKVVIEQLRALLLVYSTQQSSSTSVCSVSKTTDLRSSMPSISGLPLSIGLRKLGSLWGNRNKYDDKFVMSTYDDDCMLDLTEDNTSVASEEGWDLEQIDVPTQPSVAFC
jgi:hypothetical protein